MKPNVEAFFDAATWTLTYVVWDPVTRDAVIVDPVLDYDPAASRASTQAVERVADFVTQHGLRPHYVLETHAHADHLSGSQELKQRFPGLKVAIGERIREVQALFATKVFNLGADFPVDGSQFDKLLADKEILQAGSLCVEVIATPGHTPACVSYLIGDALFTGDALFMPDFGVGRCDFPAGSPETLYDSVIGRLYPLADSTRVFVGHDYQPNGRKVAWESTVGEEKRANIQLRADTSRADFVRMRTERDAGLPAPRLLLASVQVNIDAGRMPRPDRNGTSYLKIPLRR